MGSNEILGKLMVWARGYDVVVEMTAVLPGSPDTVWRLITDWENQGDWMLEAGDFVVTSDHRRGLGVTAAATIKIAGIKTRDEVRVVAWDPGRRLSMEHLGWVSGRGDIHLSPIDEGTYIFWRERLRPPLGFAGALGLTALKPLMRRIFERDLKVLGSLVRAAEAGAGLAR